MDLTQEQINQLKLKGLTDDKIQAIAQQNGYNMPTKTLSVSQVSALKQKGLTDEKIQTIAQQNGFQLPKVGIVQSLAQSVAQPVLKMASSVRSIPEIWKAKTLEDIEKAKTKDYSYGPLGTAKPLQNPVEAAAVGAEIGSYAIGGGGTKAVVQTGLKGKLIKSGLEGLLTGAGGGGLMSFGQALQDAENKPSNVAYKTLFGALTGGAIGVPASLIAPVISKAVGVTKRFTNLNQINNELTNLNTSVFKPNPTTIEKWSLQGKNPIKTYTEIFGNELPEVDKNNRFIKESIDSTVDKINSVYKPASEAFNTILRNSPEVNSLNKAKEIAIKNLESYNLTPEMQEKAILKIEDNFNSIKRDALKNKVLLGDDSIPVYYSDNLKDRFWAATKNFGTEDATIANSVNSSIGHGFQKSIENSITDLNVKNFNRRLGDLIVLRDFIESKIGELAGTGGKAARYAARIAGTVAGAQGGPLTSILGNITGDKLAQILINPAYQPYRWLITKQLQKLPQSKIMQLEQEANDVLLKMYQKRAETLALPSPQFENVAGIKTPVIKQQTNPIQLGGETTFEKPAEKIGYQPVTENTSLPTKVENTQPLITSESIPPITTPTTIENNKNIIQTNNNINKLKDKGITQVSGGIAGIEVKKDENGKTVITFNPEKAVIGVIGSTSYSKLSPIIKNNLKTKLTSELRKDITKLVSQADTKPLNNVFIMGKRAEFGIQGDINATSIVDELKAKLDEMEFANKEKVLSEKDAIRALPALKSLGYDIVKPTIKKMLNYIQDKSTGKMKGSVSKFK